MALACSAALAPAHAQGGAAPVPRPLRVDDLTRYQDVREPQVSPEGEWVAYTVSTVDADKDRWSTDLWMTRWDGTRTLRLTYSGDVDGTPRWSPQGHYLAFLASRSDDDEHKQGSQLWLLDRAGGEARKVTDAPGGITDFAWSPDERRIALVVTDADPSDEPEKLEGWSRKTKPPIVIDRYHFKQDKDGYLGKQQTHLALLDLPEGRLTPLGKSSSGLGGPVSEMAPVWSPDGLRLAFYSSPTRDSPPDGAPSPGDERDPDRTEEVGLYVMDAVAGAPATRLARFVTNEGEHPAWSPDGRWIAFLQGDALKFSAYHRFKLMLAAPEGGALKALSAGLDRSLQGPLVWSADSRSLAFSVEDDRTAYAARVGVDGGDVERLSSGRRVVSALSAGGEAEWAVLASGAAEPPEVYALKDGALRRLSHHNDDWLGQVAFGATEDFTSVSADGTEVHGLLSKPAAYEPGLRYPTVLLIHGGPNGQDAHEMDVYDNFLRHLLAARGYVVLQANYRGSSGRGDAFQKAIFADWGHLEVQDLLGAVDWAVAQGIADPSRLAVGGWSYGGLLTDYLIASDTRFKAAVSGAGSGNQISMFGSDQYIVQYLQELGPPWQHPELWLKVSYPFFQADRIKTPTLFLSGDHDFNVPTAGSEQMYQALRVLGVPTRLVIYPGQFHSFAAPSYEQDVMARYIAWFDQYTR